jgi:hypothetical protein
MAMRLDLLADKLDAQYAACAKVAFVVATFGTTDASGIDDIVGIRSLIATSFLTQETRRGKNLDPRADGAAAPLVYRGGLPPGLGLRPTRLQLPHQHTPPETDRASAPLLVEEETQPCATSAG